MSGRPSDVTVDPLFVVATSYQLARSYAEIDSQLGPDRTAAGWWPRWRHVHPQDGERVMRGRRPGRYVVVTHPCQTDGESRQIGVLTRWLDAAGWTRA